jgi:hypothetical protein
LDPRKVHYHKNDQWGKWTAIEAQPGTERNLKDEKEQ